MTRKVTGFRKLTSLRESMWDEDGLAACFTTSINTGVSRLFSFVLNVSTSFSRRSRRIVWVPESIFYTLFFIWEDLKRGLTGFSSGSNTARVNSKLAFSRKSRTRAAAVRPSFVFRTLFADAFSKILFKNQPFRCFI